VNDFSSGTCAGGFVIIRLAGNCIRSSSSSSLGSSRGSSSSSRSVWQHDPRLDLTCTYAMQRMCLQQSPSDSASHLCQP
jgi:hypothetical protein